jgi:hypothetical protein
MSMRAKKENQRHTKLRKLLLHFLVDKIPCRQPIKLLVLVIILVFVSPETAVPIQILLLYSQIRVHVHRGIKILFIIFHRNSMTIGPDALTGTCARVTKVCCALGVIQLCWGRIYRLPVIHVNFGTQIHIGGL